MEDIDFRTARGLDRQLVRSLVAESVWVREHQNLFLLGPTGIGKTWLARAFAQKACRDGYTAYFTKATELFRDLAMARADGSLRKLLYRLSRVDVLIVDDWAMAPLADGERREFLEICDERYQARSMLLTSQLPVSAWHAQIGDPTVADSILDRLVHNAHRLELAGRVAAEEAFAEVQPAKSERATRTPSDPRAVEMTDRGKPKTGFPRSLENAGAFPTFPPHDDYDSPSTKGTFLWR